MYVNADDDVTQDVFCQAVKKLTKETEALVLSLSRMVTRNIVKKQQAEHDLEVKEELFAEKIQNISEFLIRMDMLYDNSEIRDMVIAMIGRKIYIKTKIAMGFQLSDADAKIIDNLLK